MNRLVHLTDDEIESLKGLATTTRSRTWQRLIRRIAQNKVQLVIPKPKGVEALACLGIGDWAALTNEEIMKKTGVDKKTIRKYRKGKNLPATKGRWPGGSALNLVTDEQWMLLRNRAISKLTGISEQRVGQYRKMRESK